MVSTLNLGILAHVDAGKTSLTERLLYAAGVIDEIGSVDAGSTQTDSLALERQRGITIKSAVVSFAIGDVTVNLIDTPGHPDFIAEVERVLGVLDGAVLVISAVEGVQAQTRVLMRALQRLRHPDADLRQQDRPARGARPAGCCDEIAARLTPADRRDGTRRPGERRAAFVPYGAGDPAFTARLVDLLAEHDDALLAAYVGDETGSATGGCGRRWPRRPGAALVHPVFFGSAITGAGVDELIAGIAELLPAAARRRRTARCRARCSRSSAGRPGRRSPTCGCSPARCGSGTGSATAARRRRSPRSACSTRGGPVRRRPGRGRARSASSGACADVRIGDAIGVAAAGRGRAPLRPADAGDRRRAGPARATRARCTSRWPSSPSRTR